MVAHIFACVYDCVSVCVCQLKCWCDLTDRQEDKQADRPSDTTSSALCRPLDLHACCQSTTQEEATVCLSLCQSVTDKSGKFQKLLSKQASWAPKPLRGPQVNSHKQAHSFKTLNICVNIALACLLVTCASYHRSYSHKLQRHRGVGLVKRLVKGETREKKKLWQRRSLCTVGSGSRRQREGERNVRTLSCVSLALILVMTLDPWPSCAERLHWSTAEWHTERKWETLELKNDQHFTAVRFTHGFFLLSTNEVNHTHLILCQLQ